MFNKLKRWKWVIKNFKNYPVELNRRAGVEQQLWNMSAGVIPLPDKEKCAEMARTLGVPEAYRIR